MSPVNPLRLLISRRFLPLLLTHALGAFNDNLFKNALIILILYQLSGEGGEGPLLVTAAAGIFILPFFLFSALGGQLADKLEKSGLIRILKLTEIGVMLLGTLGFILGSVPVLLVALFLMGAQSALFSPVKYALLPEHLHKDELIAGNGLMEGTVYLAILGGTLGGSLLIIAEGGIEIVSALVVGLAAAGILASRFVPKAPVRAPETRINPNILVETWRVVRHASGHRGVLLSILGIAWFHLMGATYLAQFPNFAKTILFADEQVVALFLATFSIGIGIGATLCHFLLRGVISARLVPWASLAIGVFGLDMVFAARAAVVVESGSLMTAEAFLAHLSHWRILGDLFGIALCGGLFIVPLYALIQHLSAPAHRARALAASNILNALFIATSSGLAAALLAHGIDVATVFLWAAGAHLGISVLAVFLVPETVRPLLRWIMKSAFRLEVRGRENLDGLPDKAVFVANHTSYLDGAALAATLSSTMLFTVNKFTAKKWWAAPFVSLVEALRLDPSSPFAAKTLIRAVERGRHCLVFPEGRLTETGGLMKSYDGPALVAARTGAPVVPIRLEGLERSHFSRLGDGRLRRVWFPKVTITIGKPVLLCAPDGLVGREKRRALGRQVAEVLAESAFATAQAAPRTLFQALLAARQRHGGGRLILHDAMTRTDLSYNRLVTAALALGRPLARETRPGETVGLMLPTSAGAVAVFFALQAVGRVSAWLNFTSGGGGMASCCRTAAIRTVLTARQFVEKARLEEAVAALEAQAGVRVLYLEDLRAGLGFPQRLRALAAARLCPDRRLGRTRPGQGPDDPAVVLFTSGSEGAPKGVVLSAQNLLANCRQLAAWQDYNSRDKLLNVLPIFHGFGLTGGVLTPLLGGVPTVLYPSPLHYRVIPELAYDSGATILFGTDSFLSGYARTAHPYDFHRLRLVFAGAEKLREETRRLWADRFGVRVLEGYGATETAAVLAVNTPLDPCPGSVGRFLPGLTWRLVPEPGITDGGRLWVQGPNVMRGYLRPERPGEIQPLPEGWYDTGDIVTVDAQGFVHIRDRAKRFAKVAGEMVSLAAAEELARKAWPQARHAVISLPEPGRGEQLVLVTEQEDAERDRLLALAKGGRLSELLVPRRVVVQNRLPLLGTGKVDYQALRAEMLQALQRAA